MEHDRIGTGSRTRGNNPFIPAVYKGNTEEMMLVLFPAGLSKLSVEFWFMMQVALLTGFFFSYPVNWWLIRRGMKPSM